MTKKERDQICHEIQKQADFFRRNAPDGSEHSYEVMAIGVEAAKSGVHLVYDRQQMIKQMKKRMDPKEFAEWVEGYNAANR